MGVDLRKTRLASLQGRVSVYRVYPIQRDRALTRPKVDEFVPEIQHVNLGIVRQRA